MTTQLHQIYEYDLETLERELPQLMTDHMRRISSKSNPEVFTLSRKAWEAVQRILMNVRWDYGPPIESETLAQEDTGEGGAA